MLHRQRRFWSGGFIPLGCFGIASVFQDPTRSDANDDIVLRLTPQSKLLVSKKLTALRIKDYVPTDVIVSRNAIEAVQNEFAGIYGNRVAFRLKGYVKTKNRGRNDKTESLLAVSESGAYIVHYTYDFCQLFCFLPVYSASELYAE